MVTSRRDWLSGCLALLALSCEGELSEERDAGVREERDAGVRVESDGAVRDAGAADARIPDARVSDASVPRDAAVRDAPARFRVTIENLAGPAFPTAIASGVWTLHTERDPLFTEGAPDRGLGLEALAEDGDPRALLAALDPIESGAIDGPILPGARAELVVEASERDARLSFAAMISESNDLFLAPSGAGIALFDASGAPLAARDVTHELALFDAGTEADQPPGQGGAQGARQPTAGLGEREGVVRRFDGSTRALPLARDLARVEITESGGAYTVSIENVSSARRALVTALSPVFFAVHDAQLRLFELGAPDPGLGLEPFAEEGDARALLESAAADEGVLASGTTPSWVHPGARVSFTVRPDAAHRFLTLATHVLASNDALVALDRLPLLDASGNRRPPGELGLELARALLVIDAGTEANEIPGAGRGQPPGAGGAPDPDRRVRRYADATNEHDGPRAGGGMDVTVRRVRDTTFEVRVTNTTDELLVAATAYAITDGRVRVFEEGAVASPALEHLAEDCVPRALAEELARTPGVLHAASVHVPDGASEAGPLRPGGSYTFTVTADAAHRWLVLVNMPFPSNDLFVSLGERGVALLDERGAHRSSAAIAADVRASLLAYDAGTEANQAGAAGHDMPPYQERYDMGAPEGDGMVRRASAAGFTYPDAAELVRVTITPLP